MSKNIVDFDTLKYNLYEVLGVTNDATEAKIKKAYRNLVLNFHPDKNNDTEEEIYFHIVTANQVLSNKDMRKNYNDFLNKTNDDHYDLKKTFTKEINEIPVESKEGSLLLFNKINQELEKKHMNNFEDKSKRNFEDLIKERENEINIDYEDIKSPDEFNLKFENRINSGNFNNQIITSKEKMDLTFAGNDNFTTLDVAFNNLYVDGDQVSTSKFTSLDSAFKIYKVDKFKESNIKDSINSYKSETEIYSANNIEFTNDRFDSW